MASNPFDLTFTITNYLDLHLIFPWLEFLEKQNVYPSDEILKTKLSLLSKTHMEGYAGDAYKKLNKLDEQAALPAEMMAKRKEVVAKLKDWKSVKENSPLFTLLADQELTAKLKADKELDAAKLESEYKVTKEHIDSLYRYAKFSFDCGNYSETSECLGIVLHLSNDPEREFKALWGKLAAEILMQKWQEAKNDIEALREKIENQTNVTPVKQLQQRTWLMHWSLFVLFNYRGREIFEWFLQEKYLNAIQTACPHILRYLTALLILNKRKGVHLKELVKVIQQETYTYRDPITEFLEALYINFDFEGAEVKLRECEKVLDVDFLLFPRKSDFLENARLLIFETYCRIHQCIDIGMLAQKLNMDRDSAEKWIVNLIRNAKLDAKIDSKANTVIMGVTIPSVYQQVIEKTKQLSIRAQQSHSKRQHLSASTSSLAASTDQQPQTDSPMDAY